MASEKTFSIFDFRFDDHGEREDIADFRLSISDLTTMASEKTWSLNRKSAIGNSSIPRLRFGLILFIAWLIVRGVLFRGGLGFFRGG